MNEENLIRSSDLLFKKYLNIYSKITDNLNLNLDHKEIESHKSYSGILEKTMSFVVATGIGGRNFVPQEETDKISSETVLDLPYKSVHIEPIEGVIGRIGTKEQIQNNNHIVHSFMVHEKSPGDYLFCVLMNGKYLRYISKGEPLYKLLLHYSLSFISKIKEFNVGTVDVGETVLIRTHKQKIKHKINYIIFVSLRKWETDKQKYLGKNVDYSHRFCVRGHWRKCSFIGKDREGNYTVTGFTWITPHIRGPEDKPLINNKLRIVSKTGHGTIYTGVAV